MVSVINASHQTLQDVKVTAKVINNDMEVAWEDSQRITVSPDCYRGDCYGAPVWKILL
ncbi:hypothetical protein NIB75_02800 [Bacteroides uniformis]|nr:hypothetical protein [Bacteroides uniformis]